MRRGCHCEVGFLEWGWGAKAGRKKLGSLCMFRYVVTGQSYELGSKVERDMNL